MPSDMPIATQRTSIRIKPQSAMMRNYLASDPDTATERLIAQSCDAFKTSTSITAAEKASLMEAYLDQLVRKAQGDRSDRRSTSSNSTF